MPRYCIEALERFLVQTTYFVEAGTAQEAERLCRNGKIAYDRHEIEDGDDEWIETLSIEAEDIPQTST